MGLLVDTSVWSLAYRRDSPAAVPHVAELRRALAADDEVSTTGIALTELLRGFLPERAQAAIRRDFAALTPLEPSWDDYAGAAALSNECRRNGVQLGAVDALLAQLAIAHGLVLLTTDRDFLHAAGVIPLRVWGDTPR